MSGTLSWGILGTGNIANQFAAGVAGAKRGDVVAVGSRSADSAAAFADRYQVAKSHASYDALLADNSVDAVYLSLPNSMHCEWTIKALEAGKHVLCEKPVANNADQAQQMFDVAKKADRLLVEAFMYRSHPLTHAVLEQLQSGAIGTLKLIRTSFCYRTMKIDGNVRFSHELAGGALMDIGCYCINFSRTFAGAEPTSIHAIGQMHETGVDVMVAGTLGFPDDVMASFTCGMNSQADNAAYLHGDEGYIVVPVPWKPPVRQAEFTIARGTPPRMDKMKRSPGPSVQTFYVDADVPLYALEADDFAAAVFDGAPPAISEADTVGNMRVLDELRKQIGLRFDGE